MYPARFEYLAPSTLEEVIATLTERGDEAKVLAGGQSLIPLMKLRIAAPSVVVDLNGVPDLDYVEEIEDGLCIGALARHKTCETSKLLRKRYRLLGDAAPLISDPLIRNRGTVCGSLAHADPQGDWGAVMLAARGEVVAHGPGGERTIPIDDLLRGPFTTSLSPDEVITEARVPDPGARTSGTYLKLERKVGDYATAAVAIQITLKNGTIGEAGIALDRRRSDQHPCNCGRGLASRSGALRCRDRERGEAGGGGRRAAIGHPRHGRLQAQRHPRLHR